ncbi:uncharacterized protein LACBIDRAFT_324618 [Laccaria bicolor S238N-H82]|uniref:Predicted protein n=1 Tax=Laccaria bicolor (strain S238N-H82 / ATCC MYA-4686) TaxID=486041 RepID=B0D2H6_LACBS|nr:uncharacterized protein LACBIDRAFT_324618 [Laccaria bicolor S238N-H82]EDR11099.1 predicted protein [Laccaria bicolor S238N-H82]|eukprot:XP_001878400.1 predicted protein [Laccaria bicolor S238N-H82]
MFGFLFSSPLACAIFNFNSLQGEIGNVTLNIPAYNLWRLIITSETLHWGSVGYVHLSKLYIEVFYLIQYVIGNSKISIFFNSISIFFNSDFGKAEEHDKRGFAVQKYEKHWGMVEHQNQFEFAGWSSQVIGYVEAGFGAQHTALWTWHIQISEKLPL